MRSMMVLAVGFLLAGEASAQAAPVDVFKELAGSCWRSQMDANQTDTHCFAAAVGGKMLTDTHKVRNAKGEVVYEGLSIYQLDTASGALAYEYFYSAPGKLTGYAWRVGEEIWFGSKPDQAKPDIIWNLSRDSYTVTPATPELGHRGAFARLKVGE